MKPNPQFFNNFALQFHQDLDLEFASIDEAISSISERLNQTEVLELKTYLAEMLECLNDKELSEFWFNSQADIYFTELSIRDFFLSVLYKLDLMIHKIKKITDAGKGC